MDTGVLPQNTILVSTIPPERPLQYIPPHYQTRVNSHVSLFRRKFWASKVMYRGSAADFLVLQRFCADPGTPQQGDYTHLVNFLRLSSMQKVVLFGGCSSRVLGGLLLKTTFSGTISSLRAEGTWCCRSKQNRDLAWTAKAQL